MDSSVHTNGNRDAGKHFVISGGINIRFKQQLKTSPKLEVRLNEQRVIAKTGGTGTVDDGTIDWGFENDIHVFPRDVLNFQLSNGERSIGRLLSKLQRDSCERFQITFDDIDDKFEGQCEGQQEVIPFVFVDRNYDVMLKIAESDAIPELKPLLPAGVQSVIASTESLRKLANTLPLISILESTPFTEDALQAIGNAMSKLGDVHPLAKAIITALSIPYDLLKNEGEFRKNVNDLVGVMHSTCRCLMDARYHTKIESAKELFVSIMRTLRDAALFVDRYRTKGRVDQFFKAQFPGKVERFAENLIREKNEFQMVMIMQIARDVDKLASMTSDDFLRKRLDPIEGLPFDEGCFEGTRVAILHEAREWIRNTDTKKNILWIVGAPGAGKSTIATTLARELADNAPFCATFFCKRDTPALRSPRNIWRTLAYGLARQHDGAKSALMRILDRMKGEPRNELATEQFKQLIKDPLTTDSKEMSFRSHKTPYPLIIIDALDECFTDDTEWNRLLESLGSWAQLPSACKIIITSRDLFDIRQTLGGKSHRIDLTSGDSASDESRRDVEIFFVSKFASIREMHRSLGDLPVWPDKEALRILTQYAAGLFVWADMVVKYIGLRTGGSNPDQRLQCVLSDIKTQPGSRSQQGPLIGPEGRDPVDRLYARIIFEAFRRSNPMEREKGKRVLAAILLAKEPLRKNDLVSLLSTDNSARHYSASLDSTLIELRPIIPIHDDTAEIRFCHKTIFDFLLSRERSALAMKFIVQQWNQQTPDYQILENSDSFTIDTVAENGYLALACIRLASQCLFEDIRGTITLLKKSVQPIGPLNYSHLYWFTHLEEAGANWTPAIPNFKGLVNSLKVAYRCLWRYPVESISSKKETLELAKSLSSAASYAIQCVNREQHIVKDFQLELGRFANDLDIARGHFQIAVVLGLTRDVRKRSTLGDAAESFLRTKLQPSNQAQLDSECLKGTRISVRRIAKDWLEDPNAPNLLWIVGAPGAGKSTLATTLVNEFSKSRLCAKVFAKRDYLDRRDPSRIWRTLAFDLASLHVGMKGSIMESLLTEPHHPENSIEEQLRFRKITNNALHEQQCLSVVCIIDALDECFTDSEDNEHWNALLMTLAGCADLPRTFRLVVTSRDIQEIRDTLASVSCCIDLHAKDKAFVDEAKSDMRLTLRAKLLDSGMPDDTRAYWLQEDIIQRLTEYAAGSFIWAKMFVELVKLNPHSSLEGILVSSKVKNAKDVDTLYAKLLYGVLGQLSENERDAFRSTLAVIVFAKNPFREVELTELLSSNVAPVGEKRQLVVKALKEFSSILSVDENQRLRIPHKSFVDFILDPRRSLKAIKRLLPKDQKPCSFLISREEDCVHITLACLHLMNTSLKFNICGIKTSHVRNDDIPELACYISNKISYALIYACRFWAEHLKDCNHKNKQFRALAYPPLKTFVYKHLLHWLEACSILKEIPLAERSLAMAAYVLKGYHYELAEVVRDAQLFVHTFEQPITAAASHIYVSALPFCPSNSHLAQIYGSQYPSVLSVVSGRRKDWDTPATTADGHEKSVKSVAFFPCGRKFTSGSNDGMVRTWDARTGLALSKPFNGRKDWVQCVVVSPDGNHIASCYFDGVLCIWDSNTGACLIGPFKAHSTCIYSIAFSPDGSRIASGSNDRTVRVWNVENGDLCLGPLTGHNRDVKSVVFSPDGKLIVSGSFDKTIRIWDAYTGESRRNPLTECIGLVHCVAFSPDGHYLASGSFNGEIHVWDVTEEFSLTRTVTTGSAIVSLSFAPDSSSLASGSDNGTLSFWNFKAESGGCEQDGVSIHGHTNSVQSVAFAPDGLAVASGSYDRSIKIWMVPTASAQYPENVEFLYGHGGLRYDEPFIDGDGWMRYSRTEGAGLLFWVPEENREFFCRPQNIAVIHHNVTKLDYRRYVHGDRWVECRRILEEDKGV